MQPQPQGPLSLGAEFPAPSHEDWRALVDTLLKGGDFEKRLVSRTYDGLRIDPLSTRAGWPGDTDTAGFPGARPFTRHARAAGGAAEGWEIRQRHTHPDPAAANAAILDDLTGGVMGIGLVADTGADPHGGGVHVPHLDALDRALKDVMLDLAPIAIEPRDEGFAAAGLMMALWDRRGHGAGSVSGALNIDPIGTLAATGHLAAPMDAALARAGAFAAHVAAARPKVRSLSADTRPYHNAGASEAQELAAALATGVAYLRAMENAGLGIDDACRQLQFTFAADADQFMTIAKLRAARLLWAKVAEASGAGGEARAMVQHVQTSSRMMARRDPWVNLLRTTMATFAAACAGAESIAVLPYTEAVGPADGLARRLARNIQIILMEESGLARVIDPAGGAWSIERLTEDLAAHAWTLFQEIEREGGMAASLTSGALSTQIARVHGERMRNIATRTDPITGVSEFPDLSERAVTTAPVDLAALKATAASDSTARGTSDTANAALAALKDRKTYDGAWAAGIVAAADAGATGAAMTKMLKTAPLTQGHLPRCRLAEPFEALRDAGDAHRARAGHHPQAALICLGRLADYTARATFARNLLAAGGIDAVDSGPLDSPSAAADALTASGSPVAVLCASKDTYESHAAETIDALTRAGARMVILTGRPGEADTAPVDYHIFTGCDALEVLRDIHARLNVTPGGAR